MLRIKETINILRKNSRTNFSSIARYFCVSTTTTHVLKNYLEKNVIKKNVTIINFENYGYKRYFLIIKNPSLTLKEFFKKRKYVNNLYETDSGISMDCIFKNNKEKIYIQESLCKQRIEHSFHLIVKTIKIEEMKI